MESRKVLCWNPSRARGALPLDVFKAQWDVHTAVEPQRALELLYRHKFHVGVIHLDRYDDGIRHHVENFLTNSSGTEWVALLQRRCLESECFCELLRASFFDFHTLPADPVRLSATLGHAYGMARLKDECMSRTDAVKMNGDEMVGASPAMEVLFTKLRKLASVDAPVLITGESGTGKELAALAIHRRSARASGPFVAVNCGALPANLIQSELFGHEKGAFTGAHQRKIGRIEAAAGGTVFLDEIGDLPLDQQVNLLRFLQENTIDRVGGTQSVTVDVRVIAATHMDLEQAVHDGCFREDLFYRLNVLHLHVPPLREREGDIELLARYLFDKFAAEKSGRVKGFSQQALRLMTGYHWPGNVRELINRVRRAMLMCEGRLVSATDLGLDRRSGKRHLMTLEEARAQAEGEAIKVSLRHARNNVSQAAKQLGISRVTLYRLMDKYGTSLMKGLGHPFEGSRPTPTEEGLTAAGNSEEICR